MSKLPTLTKILAENFPDSPDIQRISGILNQFMLETIKAFDKQLTFAENITSDVKTVVTDGTFPLYLAWTLNKKPIIALVGSIRRADGADFTLSSAVSVDWNFDSNGRVAIKGFPGLPASGTNQYILTMLFLVG